MKINNNNEEFIFLYNELDKYLSKFVGSGYTSFKNKLDYFSGSLGSIEDKILNHQDNKFFLDKVGNIRNIIGHNNFNYISVNDNTIKKLKLIYTKLINPETCYEIFKIDVFKCLDNTNLVDVIKIMKDNLFTHIPVYSISNEFLGVLSESTITYFIGTKIEKDGILLLDNIKISDLNLNNGNDSHIFITRNTTIYEIESKFFENIVGHKRLGAVFITNLGNKNEKIDGIITAWDLPRIKSLY